MENNGHDSRAIANIFVRLAQKAGDRLTIMPLVKYIYFAHGWTLGHTGKPLICDTVEAWKYGPVIPVAYNAFRDKGFIVSAPARDKNGREYQAELSPVQKQIVEAVYQKYSALTSFQMSDITHLPDSPWSKYRDDYFAVIPNEDIAAYYRERVATLKHADA